MLRDDSGYENLHLHTHYSLLDGYGFPDEYAERAKKINQRYLCVTDHGMMGAIPAQIRACEQHGITPLFGCELYVQNKQPAKDIFEKMTAEDKRNIIDDNGLSLRKSYHLLAIAFNNVGYSNLVQLCTWGHLEGYYYRPRVTHEQLKKHKEGIIFTSCCYNSEIGQAFDRRGPDAALDVIKKYKRMFGDNFYLEIMLLDFCKQLPYDKFIIEAHDKLHIPLIVTNDCHYCNQEDSKYQRYMLMIQKDTTVQDIENLSAEEKMDAFELQDQNLWMKSEIEINQKWKEMYWHVIPDDLLTQAKENTVRICEKAKGVEIDRSIKLPQVPDADDEFKHALFKGFKERGLRGGKYEKRLREEYELICRKGFASYFLIQQKMTDEARRICPELLGWGTGDEAVGPGRGSAVGSLACYCLGITDVDPIQHNLLFSRFLSESRGGRSMKLRFKS